jgi:hypothetical protein
MTLSPLRGNDNDGKWSRTAFCRELSVAQKAKTTASFLLIFQGFD